MHAQKVLYIYYCNKHKGDDKLASTEKIGWTFISEIKNQQLKRHFTLGACQIIIASSANIFAEED